MVVFYLVTYDQPGLANHITLFEPDLPWKVTLPWSTNNTSGQRWAQPTVQLWQLVDKRLITNCGVCTGLWLPSQRRYVFVLRTPNIAVSLC